MSSDPPAGYGWALGAVVVVVVKRSSLGSLLGYWALPPIGVCREG
jgi:hypothetical protein